MIFSAKVFLCLLPATSLATTARDGLSDPDTQPKFVNDLPNPLDPSFIFDTSGGEPIEVGVSEGEADTGLLGPDGEPVKTPIWGYGTPELGYTWPGRTFIAQKDKTLNVHWRNDIPIEPGYLITGVGNFLGESVVDTSYHWAYSIEGYKEYTIEEHGTPIVPHLHGGHTSAFSDGNPEYFFTPSFEIKGPQWHHETYEYGNSQNAACLWYHDHALGITRLNVYAGMAGFYIVRDSVDTGGRDNERKLPAFPYEVPLVVQDRMFKETGELFYPAFEGDPAYADFITDEGATINSDDPTALAEFFGDHMTVNGKIWPKLDVAPRNYRFRLLNGCDSRFLVVQFVAVEAGATAIPEDATPIEFEVIGADQGLGKRPTKHTTLVNHPSSRLDIIFDFSPYAGKRIIIKNIGGDEPFGGDIPGPKVFEHSDKIMSFDVVLDDDPTYPDEYGTSSIVEEEDTVEAAVDNVRRLGLFEGHDQFGRLQPLLGTIDPATDINGDPINWPETDAYKRANLSGPMRGTATWHAPTTEHIRLGDVEEWEIWNLSADAHPIHVHLVEFTIVSRKTITFDSLGNEYGEVEDGNVAGDGTYTADMALVQHDGTIAEGYMVFNPTEGELVDDPTLKEHYAEEFPLDSVVALPGQITTIRAKFDQPGRYNWHCHILAHEDHEMMRIYYVHDASGSTALVTGGLLLLSSFAFFLW